MEHAHTHAHACHPSCACMSVSCARSYVHHACKLTRACTCTCVTHPTHAPMSSLSIRPLSHPCSNPSPHTPSSPSSCNIYVHYQMRRYDTTTCITRVSRMQMCVCVCVCVSGVYAHCLHMCVSLVTGLSMRDLGCAHLHDVQYAYVYGCMYVLLCPSIYICMHV